MSFNQSILKTAGAMFVSAQGELFNHCDSGGPMWDGQDDREFRQTVVFDAQFDAPPMVTLGLSGLDIAHEKNARLTLTPEEITATGFVVVLKTWSDTRIGRASVSWMAVGAHAVEAAEPPISPPRQRGRGNLSQNIDPDLEGLITRERRLAQDQKRD